MISVSYDAAFGEAPGIDPPPVAAGWLARLDSCFFAISQAKADDQLFPVLGTRAASVDQRMCWLQKQLLAVVTGFVSCCTPRKRDDMRSLCIPY